MTAGSGVFLNWSFKIPPTGTDFDEMLAAAEDYLSELDAAIPPVLNGEQGSIRNSFEFVRAHFFDPPVSPLVLDLDGDGVDLTIS